MDPLATKSEYQARFQAIQASIAAACQRVERAPSDVLVIAVTKYVDETAIAPLVAAGVTACGENRWQQARPKIALDLPNAPHWHFIGRLQQNKVNHVVRHFDWVHSIDSVDLLESISKYAVTQEKQVPCLLQVNVSGESSKQGISPEDINGIVRSASDLPGVRLRGLMTMAPLSDEPETSRPIFRRLRELLRDCQSNAQQPDFDQLSMGMSQDYLVAVEEGATMVRVGRSLTGTGGPPSHV